MRSNFSDAESARGRRGRPGWCRRRLAVVLVASAGLLLLWALPAAAQVPPPVPVPVAPVEAPGPADGSFVPSIPDISVSVDSEDEALSRTVVIILLLTVGSVAPGLLLLMTTFTRFVVVLGLVKNGLSLHTVPPAQVLVGLALFLSIFSMRGVFTEMNEEAIQPLLRQEIGQQEAIEAGFEPLRTFMLAQTREEDLSLFVELSDAEAPATREDVGAATLIPSFVISELRTAFSIGFVILIPFVVLDLVVAAVLMSMGMMMLPPVFVSLPLKILLFVLVDGWGLISGALVGSVA